MTVLPPDIEASNEAGAEEAVTESRFAIGIDLGTTNCALAFVDRLHPGESQVLSIPQYESPGVIAQTTTLPSFLYLLSSTDNQSFDGQPARPWATGDAAGRVRVISGIHARTRAREVPGRVITSAKSWVAGSGSAQAGAARLGVDADQAILPWGSTDVSEAEKLSPIDASAHYLLHLRAAWDEQKAAFESSYRFDQQDVVVTVPASFDEVAQRLTLEAAQRAGFGPRLRLLEEPQAAFYRCLESDGGPRNDLPAPDSLQTLLQANSVVRLLVCDMGGGTTDFSVFEIRPDSSIERVAVSDHLLLGGDNIDLTLAYALESKLFAQAACAEPGRPASSKLSSGQWGFLVQAARLLKEQVFRDGQEPDGDEVFRVAIPPAGSDIFAASLSTEISGRELMDFVIGGFFPSCEISDEPAKRRTGLRELGLPYAADTAVTRHLAAFVNRANDSADSPQVDAVLFVGGSLTPQRFRDSILQNLSRWQSQRVIELKHSEFDLAVARGAAFYASLARADRRRIRAGYSHSVYLEVREARSRERGLLCVIPQGAEPGSRYRIELADLRVVLGQPVQFKACTSLRRIADQPGVRIQRAENEFHELAPLQTTVVLAPSSERQAERGEKIAVALEAEINELGMLHVYVIPSGQSHPDQRFELQFNLRANDVPPATSDGGAKGTDATVPQENSAVATIIDRSFGKKQAEGVASDKFSPANLIRELEHVFGASREAWSLDQLRELWKPLSAGMSRRSRSLVHETAWLSLAGYALRPGYGAPLDPIRTADAWKAFEQGLFFAKEARARVQWWIMWRRVAGGLTAVQHERIYRTILSTLQPKSFENSENLLLAGSLERLALDRKRELGNLLLKRLRESQVGQEKPLWALSRVGARLLFAAGPEFVLPPGDAERWMRALIAINWKPVLLDRVASSVVQLGRLTGERTLDVSDEALAAAVAWMRTNRIADAVAQPLRSVVPLTSDEQAVRFGESLPTGLVLG